MSSGSLCNHQPPADGQSQCLHVPQCRLQPSHHQPALAAAILQPLLLQLLSPRHPSPPRLHVAVRSLQEVSRSQCINGQEDDVLDQQEADLDSRVDRDRVHGHDDVADHPQSGRQIQLRPVQSPP